MQFTGSAWKVAYSSVDSLEETPGLALDLESEDPELESVMFFGEDFKDARVEDYTTLTLADGQVLKFELAKSH